MKAQANNEKIKLIHTENNRNESRSIILKLITQYREFVLNHKWLAIILKVIYVLIEILLIMLIVVTISFFLIDAAPGKPTISGSVTGAAVHAIEEKYHLNDPSVVRWARYMAGLFRWDFGISLSIFPTVSVNDFVWKRFATSSTVGVLSLLMTLVIGIPFGIWAGRKTTGLSSLVSTIFIAVMMSIPSMVFGLLLLLLGRQIGIPYIFSASNLLTWIIPALALALPSAIAYVKYIRTSMGDEITSQHAKFAKLKGATNRRFIWKHALKPSLFPVATFFPASILTVFIGGMFIEKIFMIPGSGFLMTNATQSKDTYVILLLVSLYTIMTILSFRLRDWLYVILDPRLRRRGA